MLPALPRAARQAGRAARNDAKVESGWPLGRHNWRADPNLASRGAPFECCSFPGRARVQSTFASRRRGEAQQAAVSAGQARPTPRCQAASRSSIDRAPAHNTRKKRSVLCRRRAARAT
jgi:hypothetical protein